MTYLCESSSTCRRCMKRRDNVGGKEVFPNPSHQHSPNYSRHHVAPERRDEGHLTSDRHIEAFRYSMTSRTICIAQEGPANALALNKDNSQVVIAGRNVFKIFTLLEDRFEEACNLRVGKNLNLNFSCNDVAWNLNDDHILATAATNGAVVLWNLNRQSRSKQDHVFVDHKRTVNKVSFHMTEPMWLISGSQDGTMKCFDLRIKEAIKTFYSNTESVRDVQFCPQQPYTFAAVSENGHVQQWDMRKPERYFQHFTAHSGPIFACDWHPEATWLATASRDKTIKVWDLLGKPSCDYTIHTIASVGRIKWRPQKKYHIASCALVVDCSINVWDIRRPYIPFASFNEHKDVPTGVAWRGNPQSFLSTSRDCTLYHHIFDDAVRPASKANPQSVAINLKHDVTCASKVKYEPASIARQLSNLMRRTPVTNDDNFCMASSVMNRFRGCVREPDWFKIAAENYLLSGNLSEACDHNAHVAYNFGNYVSKAWQVLKVMYTDPFEILQKSAPTVPKEDIVNTSNIIPGVTKSSGMEQSNASKQSSHEQDARSLQGENPAGAASGGDDETETETEALENQNITGPSTNTTTVLPRRPLLSDIPSTSRGDFIFGETEYEPVSLEHHGENRQTVMRMEDDDWTKELQKEAFPLRHEIKDRSPPPEQFPNHPPDLSENSTSVIVEDQPKLVVPVLPKPLPFDFTPLVLEGLHFHTAIRDVQTTVSMLIVLGEIRKKLNIPVALQEHWILEYLDLLGKFKLWHVATQIIQLAWIPSISQLNQQSTTIHACCVACTKSLQRSAWLCDHCHTPEHALCSICNQVVRGVYIWCQGCAHGGHINHMREWFNNNRQCPTGCGHLCEYN
ncbi:PREDICTED: WD repeat-containing protein 24 isoform X2 [Trachymyrmex septentrionalis]|uniref:WD repeat-containing protein 24 isoform X2 n=1 Tax=Trachymyrmex septentrionalis TaxID=34720 RepID=UPI00084F7083|nr:PREDICTED: WD repeat-containing protein 24 isoform X2 [Trachymyrmex septentrionalis]